MQGFSYGEFLIVITLTVITTLGITGSLIRFTHDQAPQQAARAIRATLRDAAERSIAQEDGLYWGVRFENLPGRDRYILFNSAASNAASPTTSAVTYLSATVQFGEPAVAQNIVFDKITGNLISSSCPSGTARSTITINTVSVYVYCNGKVE